MAATTLKPVRWVASSLQDLRRFPEEVRRGAGVLEVVEDFRGDTFRTVYTVRFAGVIYVLHAFQKKSKRGIRTPRAEIGLIEARLYRAAQDHKQYMRDKRKEQS